MQEQDEQIVRVTLPGRMYRRQGRWCWQVQLPGERAPRARTLDSDQVPCHDRADAEQAALALWQAALVRHTESLLKAQMRQQSQEKATAYAHLIDRICDRARRPSRPQIASIPVSRIPIPMPQGKPVEESPWDLLSQLSQPLRRTEGAMSCDNCGSEDFYEEYLQVTEDGRRLCPRCLQDG